MSVRENHEEVRNEWREAGGKGSFGLLGEYGGSCHPPSSPSPRPAAHFSLCSSAVQVATSIRVVSASAALVKLVTHVLGLGMFVLFVVVDIKGKLLSKLW